MQDPKFDMIDEELSLYAEVKEEMQVIMDGKTIVQLRHEADMIRDQEDATHRDHVVADVFEQEAEDRVRRRQARKGRSKRRL